MYLFVQRLRPTLLSFRDVIENQHEFRARSGAYHDICANLRAYLSGLKSVHPVKSREGGSKK